MNTPEERAAYINARVACALIEAAGMTAENMQRDKQGESMAYDSKAFRELIEEYGIHPNAVVTYLREG